ncbi:DUF4097 family beta strand repeat-containing protein [Streptomyces sp. NPDC060028]|uniref:DUF4097 family beta strand repeat-containing protein n=1 Tax=Streptomyces sp. NPDC060028 TaxID=3347041 RepID=UPI0036AF3B71
MTTAPIAALPTKSRPGARTRAHVLAMPVLVTALAGGTLTGCSLGSETDVRTYTVSQKVTALSVRSPDGDIEVVGGSGDSVKVTETVTYSGKNPKTDQSVSGGELTLGGGPDCGDDSDCKISYRLEVPGGLSVKLVAFGGDITVRNVSGAIDVRTTGGSVHGRELGAKSLLAKANGGDVEASFTAPPEKVDAGTSGGDVKVKVPGSAAYAVDAKGVGGGEKVSVRTDPASGHNLKLRTLGGTVSVSS